MKTKDLILCGLFCSLLFIASLIKIPLITMPVTLQLLTCLTAGLLCGWKTAAITTCTYIVMGLLGLPVFAMGGGFSYLLKPNFGFIIGFIPAGIIAGIFSGGYKKQASFRRMFIGALIATAVLHLIGCHYFYFMSNFIGLPFGYFECVFACTIVFLPTDFLWCVLSSLIAKKLGNVLRTHSLPL